ncbi:MAG: TonB-dependent receptor [Thermoanaerobaculia bacterium]
MHGFSRFLSVCILAGASAAVALAQAPSPTPTPVPNSPEDRIQRLEKLLADTRAEIAAIKASAGGAMDARLAEIERRIDVLAAEIEALKLGEAQGAPAGGVAAAPAVAAVEPAKLGAPSTAQRYGLGLSAAKVYGIRQGVSIGGYGEALYQNFAKNNQSGEPSQDTDQITLLRAVLYLGYKFDDHFVLNTEIEYANAVVGRDKGGEAEVEFAYVDYMHSRPFNARAGLVLIPMGLVNEQHEPTAFLGARRPDVESFILPTTWREIGGGLYGEAGPLSYRAYVVNGLNAAGYNAGEGILEGRQEGSEALAKDWAVTARLDYVGVPGLLVGASVFSGDSGQGRRTPSGQEIKGLTTVFDVHADWQWRGLWLRGLYARTSIGQAELINQANGFEGAASIGSRQEGWYLQAAFDVLSLNPGSKMSLLPFVRYERYDTQAAVPVGYERNPANDNQELTLGLAFKPIDRLVLKADWQQRHNAASTGVNQWNAALGYIF